MAVNAKGEEITSIWTPANVITCVRIVFIPLFMIASEVSFAALSAGDLVAGMSAGVWASIAFVLYVVLSATDKVDGDLARKRGEVTDFGKFLDPIADKLLVFSALLILLEHGLVNVWFVFIILLREFLVSALRMVASANGEVIAADKLGKAKTAVTMVSLCSYLLTIAVAACDPSFGPLGLLHTISWATMVTAVVLTVISGLQYFWNARHVIFRV
ncbi:MAG: CDP-diacylglycerol--glycerol-3-phosphate 3-phosphatidyltransferase [Coriobacteriaceae bacterium]|nr:CDP-diacylglycerol--glycerol-3-phosphate 3-phosphatidyltransferase [Coriobacteriaceae bacterium]